MVRKALVILACASLAVFTNQSRAGSISVGRTNMDDIVIPVFDTSLGTLDSVDLRVTLRGGVTSLGGAHDHLTYSIISTNSRSDANVGGFSLPLTTSGVSSHTHSVLTPNYAGGGITIGSFSFSTSSSGGHSHSATVQSVGFTGGPGNFRAVATVNTSAYSGHNAVFSSQLKDLTFSGGDLLPFLGVSDITIAAGNVSTSTAPSHVHSLPGFSRTVSVFSGGSWTWNFSSSTTLSAGAHSLTLDPRFDTLTTFHYTPHPAAQVPEPSSLALLLSGGLIGAVRLSRRRRT